MKNKSGQPEASPPAYISSNDPELTKKLGKYLIENARWNDLSSKELMEVYQLLMWYNTLPKKLQDNIFEINSFTPAPKKKAKARKKS